MTDSTHERDLETPILREDPRSEGAAGRGDVAVEVVLSEKQVLDALTDLPGWAFRGHRLERTFDLGSFAAAADLARRVIDQAVARRRAPRLLVDGGRLELAIGTEVEGEARCTQADLGLARDVHGLAGGPAG